MKLQTKFFSISALSILCILVLAYKAVITLNIIQENARKTELAYKAIINQRDADRWHDDIRADVTSAIAAYSLKNEDNIKDALKELDKHTGEYKNEIPICLKMELPADIHNNFVNIANILDEFIDKAKLATQNLDAQDAKSRFASFDDIFGKIDDLTDAINKQLSPLAETIKKEGEEYTKRIVQEFIIVVSITIFLACLVPFFTVLNIFRPQKNILSIMHMILEGNNQQATPYLTRSDELGDMAQALEKFRHSSIEKQDLEMKAKKQTLQAEEENRNNMLNVANSFENKVKGIVDIVVSSATTMDATAKELEKYSTNSTNETQQLSQTSIKTNSNVQDISKATNELSAAVNEINAQVRNSREFINKTSEETNKISGVVLKLEEKAKAIHGIIDIINNITSQIDLLALNATIEAARAGEMGKGFAVVANEVKALANQTSKATEQINVQISEIQGSTTEVVLAIEEVTKSMKIVNQNSASIASAIEQQSSTSSYISERVTQVASMSNSVGAGVEKVAQSSINSGNSAVQIVSITNNLFKQANILQTEVDSFLSSLRSNSVSHVIEGR